MSVPTETETIDFLYGKCIRMKGSFVLSIYLKKSTRMATLPNGIVGFIENPSTTVKPQFYRIVDLNSSIQWVIHT